MSRLTDAVEAYLKHLRVSLSAGPSTSNPRTEIALLERMRSALAEEKAANDRPPVTEGSAQ